MEYFFQKCHWQQFLKIQVSVSTATQKKNLMDAFYWQN